MANAADNPGLVQRVSSMEVTIFGVPHKERPLHDRITQLELQTLGSSKPGPLARRLDSLEKIVNGAGHRSSDGAPDNKSAVATNTLSSGRKAMASSKHKSKHAAKTAHRITATKASPPDEKSQDKTSAYLPAMAPQLDHGPQPVLAPAIAADTLIQLNEPSGSDRIRAGETTAELKVTGARAEMEAMVRNGLVAYKAGDIPEAERIFKNVLTTSPFNSDACFNLGAIDEGKGDLAAALGNYRTALIGSPDDPQIQQAIAQVESQIAQKQDSPFRNPLAVNSDGKPLLKGNASEFDPLSGQAASQSSIGEPAVLSGQSQKNSGWRTAGAIGANLLMGAARGAIRGAISGGGSGALNGALSSAGRSALGSALRAPGRSASPGVANAGRLLGGLHCPICRILP